MIKEVKHCAGPYMEVDFLPYRRKVRHGGRGKRSKPTTEAQKHLNQKARERKAYMWLHENFSSSDYEFTATYTQSNLPEDNERAQKNVRNFILRLKRLYKKHNVEFKGWFVIQKSSTGRYHHHMVISGGVPREAIEQAWGLGLCNCNRLQFTEQGITALAKYITRDAKPDEDGGDNRCTYKTFTHTRNLKPPPEPEVKQVSRKIFNNLWDDFNNRKLFEERYKDYFFVEAERKDNSEFGERYLTVKLCRKDAKLDYIEDFKYNGSLKPIKQKEYKKYGKLQN